MGLGMKAAGRGPHTEQIGAHEWFLFWIPKRVAPTDPPNGPRSNVCLLKDAAAGRMVFAAKTLQAPRRMEIR